VITEDCCECLPSSSQWNEIMGGVTMAKCNTPVSLCAACVCACRLCVCVFGFVRDLCIPAEER
jgi:hypothetical protein